MKTQDMMPGKPTRAELCEWLDRQVLCVISSIGADGYPNAATVAFSQNEALEFVIITDGRSRKASNIEADQRVSLTVTNEDDRYTLQLEGDARKISWDEFEPFGPHHYEKLPFSLPFKDIPEQTPFLIRPTHIRFTDTSVRPWETTDIN